MSKLMIKYVIAEINNNQSINTVLEGVLRFQVTSLYETSE